MTTVITVFLSILIIALLFALFVWVKTPIYRVDKPRMIRVLEMVLTGQATENDWRMVFAMSIRYDPELEEIRQQACIIEEQHFKDLSNQTSRSDYLFTDAGLAELEKLLEQLKANH